MPEVTGKHRSATERRSRGRLVAAIATPVALIVSGALVWQSTYAAFTAQVTNGSNAWSTGTVILTGDDGSSSTTAAAGTALFTATALKPGSTGTNCVKVTYSGTLAALPVKMYVSGALTGSAPLASAISITVVEGTGGTFNSCTGFTAGPTVVPTQTLAAFAAANTSYATGLAGTWSPAAGASSNRTYQVTYTLSASAGNALQGTTAGATFAWETQNS
ncbi:MAG: hypothetical protein JWM93_2333 [Frankiales bacterium]|nr:hypothetical protein [Frankiales bacterium]